MEGVGCFLKTIFLSQPRSLFLVQGGWVSTLKLNFQFVEDGLFVVTWFFFQSSMKAELLYWEYRVDNKNRSASFSLKKGPNDDRFSRGKL
jgi:hypothetical protein